MCCGAADQQQLACLLAIEEKQIRAELLAVDVLWCSRSADQQKMACMSCWRMRAEVLSSGWTLPGFVYAKRSQLLRYGCFLVRVSPLQDERTWVVV
jgi:hypothetical protein